MNPNELTIISPVAAKREKMHPLTTAIVLSTERHILDSITTSLDAGGIAWALVTAGAWQVEIWRQLKGMHLNHVKG